MLNMIKMDLYRMVRTKSMYVVWIVMAAAIFFSTSMSKLDIDTMNKEAEQQQTESIAETVKPETINMGMSVFLPTQPGEKVTVFDQVYANLQAKFVALFLVIFTVLFSSADIGSGYIKNIGGQVRSRRNLIFSKASVLFVYTTVTMLLYFIIQIIAQQMYFGYLEWGEWKRVAEILWYSDFASLCTGTNQYGDCGGFEQQRVQHDDCYLPVHEYHDCLIRSDQSFDPEGRCGEFPDFEIYSDRKDCTFIHVTDQ